MSKKVYSEPIPIMRAFEHEGEKYLYGYGVIFDSPDGHGTVMTRKFVENNLERLKKFPAVRFMHKDPLGQIVWDKGVSDPETGRQIRTFLDDHGFHILVRVYDEQAEKWNMIRNGHWGFSWSALPIKMGQVCFTNGCFPSLESGKMWEISVVDSPSHMSCEAHVLKRSLEFQKRNLQDEWKDRYPEKCSPECPFLSCPYRNPERYGKICMQRVIPPQKRDIIPLPSDGVSIVRSFEKMRKAEQ